MMYIFICLFYLFFVYFCTNIKPVNSLDTHFINVGNILE